MKDTTSRDISTNDIWTTERLKDELYLNLMHGDYEDQAKQLIYRIPVHKPTPRFLVRAKDLTQKIKQELHSLHKKALNEVMNESIGRVFECVDERYYLLSVKKLLQWEIV